MSVSCFIFTHTCICEVLYGCLTACLAGSWCLIVHPLEKRNLCHEKFHPIFSPTSSSLWHSGIWDSFLFLYQKPRWDQLFRLLVNLSILSQGESVSWKGLVGGWFCFFRATLSLWRSFSPKVDRPKEKPSPTICAVSNASTITNSIFADLLVRATPCASSFTFVLLDIGDKSSSKWHYCSNFTDKQSETDEGDVTEPRSHW